MDEFGSIMKKERIKKGLSITDLSKMTGVDIKTISLIERGLRKKPTLETLFRLSNILECIDFNMIKSFGYPESEIIVFLCDDEDFEGNVCQYEYNFHILLHGHGKIIASDIDEAYDNAEELIRKGIILNNNEGKCENVYFSKEYSILYDFGKNR